jgi:Xaa-Pro dipeptidase
MKNGRVESRGWIRAVRPAVQANCSSRLLSRSGFFRRGLSRGSSRINGRVAGRSSGIAGSSSSVGRLGSRLDRHLGSLGRLSSGFGRRLFLLATAGTQHEGNRNGAPDLCIHRQLPQYVAFNEKGKVNFAAKHCNCCRQCPVASFDFTPIAADIQWSQKCDTGLRRASRMAVRPARRYASGHWRTGAAMAAQTLGDLYPEHLQTVMARADRALAGSGHDGLIVGSGSLRTLYLDDSSYPFKPNPRYRAWLPDATPDCFVVYRPGRRPRLVFHQPDDYWYLPPALPEGYWVGLFDLVVVRSPSELRAQVGNQGRWAVLAEPGPATDGLGEHDPPALVGKIDYDRATKTAYEIACMAQATAAGVRAHRAAEAAFRAGASEYEIHLAYCRAAVAREEELPYNNIIAFDRHAAVLHYQLLDRRRPPGVRSFLIDAGAQHAGYACDITRTYAAAPGEFQDLVTALDGVQLALADRVRPGVDYRDIHLEAHRAIAGVLVAHGLVTGSPEAAVAGGMTAVFFPHGIGHLLGLMVHDAGGFMAGPDGGALPRPEGHPYLRLTRRLEAGFAVTIEPGIYFIESLLAAARADARGRAIDWRRVEALAPWGGVRIEDNVVARAAGAPRNLTREGFAAAA